MLIGLVIFGARLAGQRIRSVGRVLILLRAAWAWAAR